VTIGITNNQLGTQLKMFEIGMTNYEFDIIMAAGLEKLDNDTINAQVKAETVKVQEGAQRYDKHARRRVSNHVKLMASPKSDESCACCGWSASKKKMIR